MAFSPLLPSCTRTHCRHTYLSAQLGYHPYGVGSMPTVTKAGHMRMRIHAYLLVLSTACATFIHSFHGLNLRKGTASCPICAYVPCIAHVADAYASETKVHA